MAFAVAVSATPGPNNTAVAASGARFGVVRTLPHMLGVTIGFPIMLLLVVGGVGTWLGDHGAVAGLLRWVGAAYLLWLAWRIVRARAPTPAGPIPRPHGLLSMALFQWVNPKAWAIAVSAVVTFTTEGARLTQATMLAGLFAVVTFLSVLLWTAVGAGAARILQTERALRRFDWAMATLLVASVLPLLMG